MGKFLTLLNQELMDFIRRQPMFFVASAPGAEGRVNVSPKGLDTLRILGPDSVAYLDLSGSGNETAAHIRDNGRLTLMFCSFGETPLILRLYGRGWVVIQDDSRWDELIGAFEPMAGQRQIIGLAIESVQTSCGFGVPLMELTAQRATLPRHAGKKDAQLLKQQWYGRNAHSIDGLPSPFAP
ncbi:MAG: pyridoxamine 5'-phosphate oxidase family protein [Candidatus Sericytochromatia bacterium]